VGQFLLSAAAEIANLDVYFPSSVRSRIGLYLDNAKKLRKKVHISFIETLVGFWFSVPTSSK
jgi:hypothetical protein